MKTITLKLVEEYIAAIKKSDAECDSNPIAIFHPDTKFPEFKGMTLQEAKDAGLLPDYVILQKELPR